jgi:A/G-specific adenine glycosylase
MGIPPPDWKKAESALCGWYRKNARDLPWRQDPSPYKVWISEVFLQQTQVKTVVSRYQQWMSRFPDTESLAAASEDEVARAFEGLGYYSRAGNLHKTARVLMEKHGGALPGDMDTLRGLPGIGPYTAAAIASIAYGQDAAAADANVERVIARFADAPFPMKSRDGQKILETVLASLLPPDRAGEFNQAMMDLGALVCTPKAPACHACPLAPWCLSLARNTVAARPVRAPRPKTTAIEVAAAVIRRGEAVLVQKRPEGGRMAGLWEFPGGKLEPGETPGEAVVREIREELALTVVCGKKLISIRHAYTRFRVHLHVFECVLSPPGQTPVANAASEIRWASRGELERLAFPAADRRLVRLLEETRGSSL